MIRKFSSLGSRGDGGEISARREVINILKKQVIISLDYYLFIYCAVCTGCSGQVWRIENLISWLESMSETCHWTSDRETLRIYSGNMDGSVILI